MESRKTSLALRLRKFYKDPLICGILVTLIATILTPLFVDVQALFAGLIKADTYTCSPAGKQTNVRKGPGKQYDTLFTLDKGQYFEVLEEGQNDLVLGRTGHWRKISYNGYEGWMFSGFMICE